MQSNSMLAMDNSLCFTLKPGCIDIDSICYEQSSTNGPVELHRVCQNKCIVWPHS